MSPIPTPPSPPPPPPPFRRGRVLSACALLLLALAPTAASGQEAGTPGPLTPLRMPDDKVDLGVQPEELPEPAALEEAAPTPRFGKEGTHWFTIGAGVAHEFDEATDWNMHAAYSHFLVEDVEIAAELDLWYFDAEGDFAVGASPNLIFRWHFINNEDWTVFTDAGIGFAVSTDDVPAGGTSFNFAPRAGVGFTRRLTDGGVRLQAGARWHHISNARLTGNSNNPSRDAPLVYAGIVIPF